MVFRAENYTTLQYSQQIHLDVSQLPLAVAHPIIEQLTAVLRSRVQLPVLSFSAALPPKTELAYFPDYLPMDARTAYLEEVFQPIAAVYAERNVPLIVGVLSWQHRREAQVASPGPLRETQLTILQWAAFSGSLQVVLWVLRHAEYLPSVLNASDEYGRTALHDASMNGTPRHRTPFALFSADEG